MSTESDDDVPNARRDEAPAEGAIATPLPPRAAAEEALGSGGDTADIVKQNEAAPAQPGQSERAESNGPREGAAPELPVAAVESEPGSAPHVEARHREGPATESAGPIEPSESREGRDEGATGTTSTEPAPRREPPPGSSTPTPPPAIPAPSRDGGRRRFVVGAISALAVVVALLVVQHVRHGWPFSLHHGAGAPSAARVVTPSTGATGAQQPAPRAHVELARDRWPALGIRVIPVARETIGGALRTVVTIVPDESRVSHVHTRVSGWIDRLIVRTTGERVRRGQPLAAIFSQELLASQTEYLAALRAAPNRDAPLVRGARERLSVFGMTSAQIAALERRGTPERLVTVSAPQAGTVLRRSVTEGTAVDPSTELFTIADLSRVWALTEIPEVDAPRVRLGSTATLSVPASGLPPFDADVSFVYPTLSERTRTLRARFDVENPDGQLRPGMYGTAEFETATRDAIVVPRDAVVDTGVEQHVFVLEGEAMLVPRVVSLGVRLDERVEVTDGLREGEQIVAAGVFLIDSESRLRASGGAGAGHAHGGGGARTDTNGATDSASRGRAPRGAPQPSPGAGHEGHEAPAATGARSAPRAVPRRPAPPAPSAHGGHGGTP